MNNYRNEIRKRTIRTAPQVGKHHGEGPSDGAQRNARIAADVAARKAEREDEKEKKIADRTAAAEKRRKETLTMATEENLDEGRYSKTDTESLKGIHSRAHADISSPHSKKLSYGTHPGFADRVDTEYEARRELKKRGISVDRPKHKSVIEETGTEARTKIKNVSRPDDAEPTSKDSKLAKTGEIKNKKIDEGRSMSINRNFGLPESLIAATRSLLEKKDEDDIKSVGVGKGKTAVDTKPETDDTVNDGDDVPDKKKGKKKLDPVGKEDDDVDNDGDVDNSDKYLKNRRKAISKAMKEDVEQIDELKKSTLASYINKASDDATKHSYIAGKTGNVDTASKASQRIRGIATAAQKLAGQAAAPAPAAPKKPMKNPAAAGAAAAKADDAERAKLKAAGKKIPSRLTGVKEDVEQVDEVLSKKADAGEWIKDFTKSDNPKFAGKSPEKRKQMALAAYYAKQRNEEVEQIDEVSDKKKREYLDKAISWSHKKWNEPAKPEHLTKSGNRLKKSWTDSDEYKKGKEKMAKRREMIQKTAKAVTGQKHFSDLDGEPYNARSGSRYKYAKEEFSSEEIARLEEIAKKFD